MRSKVSPDMNIPVMRMHQAVPVIKAVSPRHEIGEWSFFDSLEIENIIVFARRGTPQPKPKKKTASDGRSDLQKHIAAVRAKISGRL
mgnify:CR=1 FL=1